MEKQNKGFTLIELLAVIVILAVLMVVAGANVFGAMTTARRNSFRTEFLSLLQAGKDAASLDVMNGSLSNTNNCLIYNSNATSTSGTKVTTATSISAPTKTTEGALSTYWENKGKYAYSVKASYQNGTVTVTGSMASGAFKIEAKDDSLANDSTAVADSSAATVTSLTCP